jgi:tetratricopeptide (TPR) repeat protein
MPIFMYENKMNNAMNAELQRAIAYCDRQQYDDAEQLLDRIITRYPNSNGAFHLKGFVRYQRGSCSEAAALISKSISLCPNNSLAYMNLGLALLGCGETTRAIKSFRKALALDSTGAVLWFNLGRAQLKAGDSAAARQSFKNTLKIDQDFLDAWLNIADIDLKSGDLKAAQRSLLQAKNRHHEQAMPCFLLAKIYFESKEFEMALNECQIAIQRNSNLPDAYFYAGLSLSSLGRYKDALSFYKRAASFNRDNPALLNILGCAYVNVKQYDKAVNAFRRACQIDPSFPEIINNYAAALYKIGDFEQAMTLCYRAISIKPNFPKAFNILGDIHRKRKEYEESRKCLDKAIELNPNYTEAYYKLGLLMYEIKDFDACISAYRKTVELDPNFYQAWNNMGNLLMFLGDHGAAIHALEEAIEAKSNCAEAYKQIVTMKDFKQVDGFVRKMKWLAGSKCTSKFDKIYLNFALGKVYEDLKDYVSAFRYIDKGNELKRSEIRYKSVVDKMLAAQLKSIFSGNPKNVPIDGPIDEPIPIFIVGMPRSGSSMIEQILANHRDVFGAGELTLLDEILKTGAQDYCQRGFPDFLNEFKGNDFQSMGKEYIGRIRDISDGSRYVTDKMPGNYVYIGAIRMMLPGAKIIHCKRNPMDTCLSIFKNIFTSPYLKYAYNQKELGTYYLVYRDLMTHWKAVFPGACYDLQYEALVSDPERQIKLLLDYCDLDWDDRCLRFHQSSRPVFTASTTQVRKPIYKDSVERWRKYEKELTVLKEVFQNAGVL